MDIEKLFKEFVEKEWHDGHEPQGGHDHHEEEEVEEGWKPIEEAFWKLNIPDMPPVFIEAGSASEIKADMRKKLKGEFFKELGIERVSKAEMVKKYRELAKGKGDSGDEEEASEGLEKEAKLKKKKKDNEFQFGISAKGGWKKGLGKHREEVEEGYKDLPPHLQKLIKKIEKKQKDWNKQNPDAKIQTLVYNPETGKPDIIVKETMKLEDTVKSVMEGKLPPALQKAIDKKKGKKDDDSEVEEQKTKVDEVLPAIAAVSALSSSKKHKIKIKKEDTDPDTPGTQGDKAKYLKARAKVLKKFGVKSCSELEGDEKKACYAALDNAHVADHEEQVDEITKDLAFKASQIAFKKAEKDKGEGKKKEQGRKFKKYHDTKAKKELSKMSQGDAQRYYNDKGYPPAGWKVKDKRVHKEDTQKSFSKMFSHLKRMMKEKKKKMLKGYSSNY